MMKFTKDCMIYDLFSSVSAKHFCLQESTHFYGFTTNLSLCCASFSQMETYKQWSDLRLMESSNVQTGLRSLRKC